MHPALPWRLSPARPRWAVVSHARVYAITIGALVCVGFALRLVLLAGFPLREDEAIYGYWARVAAVDPFFLHVWPDKPPLFIWLLTGTFALLGQSEETARLVSIFASVLTIPLAALGALRLWHSRPAGVMAALLLAFNPYAVSFAPTAYTDSMLVFFGTGALVLALMGRGMGAGLLLGAACMTKQQGLFYVPLVVALLWWDVDRMRLTLARRGATFARALLGAALVVLPILWWDSRRWAVAPSPWDWAQQNYAPLAWLPPQQWLARLAAWAEWLWYLGGSWSVWVMLAAALAAAGAMAWRNVRLLLLLGWGFAFVALHLTISVQVWDRYLLPLAPWLALVASGPIAMLLRARLAGWGYGILFLLLMVGMAELVPPGIAAARGQFPIGGDHGDYSGLTEAIAWVQEQGCAFAASNEFDALRGKQSEAHSASATGFSLFSLSADEFIHREGDIHCDSPAILYHQVLGWHFRFYLYDELQPEGDAPPRFDLRWFPSAAYLADNAAKSPYPPKYLIVPEWATPRDLDLHLALRGLALELRVEVGRFAVMEIIHRSRPMCDWCKSTLPWMRQLPVLPVEPQMSTP